MFQIDPHVMAAAVTDPEKFKELPVGLRACLAATALAAADQPVNAKALSQAGGYSRSTAGRAGSPWAPLLTALVDNPTGLLDQLVGDLELRTIGVDAAKQIQDRDNRVRELKAELSAAKALNAPLAAYAHDLATALRNETETFAKDMAAKVVPLRAVPDADLEVAVAEPEVSR